MTETIRDRLKRHSTRATLMLVPLVVSAVAPGLGATVPYCKVNVLSELKQPLCQADAVELTHQIEPLLESTDPTRKREAIELLERLWRKDATIGDGLPWQRLWSDEFQAYVVAELAPVVRDRDSHIDLKALQAFAVRYSSKITPAGYADGINLIGRTGAPGQVEYLTAIARSNSYGLGSSAIMALGSICEPAAATSLRELSTSSDIPDLDRQRARFFLNVRDSPRTQSWCSISE